MFQPQKIDNEHEQGCDWQPKKKKKSLIHNMKNGNKNAMNKITGARS